MPLEIPKGATRRPHRHPELQERSSAAAAADAPPDAVLVCLKWGQRYDAAYVNRLCAAASRQLPSAPRCVCFTESPEGIDASIEVRELPEKFHLWWGKAYLFSEEAGLDGKLV